MLEFVIGVLYALVPLHLFRLHYVSEYSFLHTVDCYLVSLFFKQFLKVKFKLSIVNQIPIASLTLRMNMSLILK